MELNRSTREFISGWCGGVAGVVIGFPLDTIKVNIQLNASDTRGILATTSALIRSGGVRSLFSGILSPISSYGALVSLNFGTYGSLKHMLRDPNDDGDQPLYHHSLAGLGSGCILALISNPFELVKVQMQSQGASNTKSAINTTTTWKCAKSVFKAHGLRGFYRGRSLAANAAVFIPGSACYFATFEYLNRNKVVTLGNSPVLHSLISGAITGVIYWGLVFPFDSIKSRLILDCKNANPTLKWADVAKQLYRTKSLYRGFTAAVIRGIPVNATMLTVNDQLNTFLHLKR